MLQLAPATAREMPAWRFLPMRSGDKLAIGIDKVTRNGHRHMFA